MMRFLRKIVTPNAQTRRIMSGICAAFMLVTIFFSSILLAAEADHDCRGHDCQICLEMQDCIANLQLLGSSTTPSASPLPEISLLLVDAAPYAHRAPATSLQSLDVRFDE